MSESGTQSEAEKGKPLIDLSQELGEEIPHFCYHPGIGVDGNCRLCLVELEGAPKLVPACTLRAGEGMEVRTNTEKVVKARQGVLEFLLLNHPLDCPICDKGGECPLQNQAMANGRGESRYDGVKRTYPKPINISAQVLLDRERCVLCQRCTRFADQIAGDPFINLQERGAVSQIGAYQGERISVGVRAYQERFIIVQQHQHRIVAHQYAELTYSVVVLGYQIICKCIVCK